MIEKIKNFINYVYVDKYINDGKFDIALEKLNVLANEDFRPDETYLKRGMLCHKLLMFEEAYSDFTYIITHCAKKEKAYIERIKLNYEMGNFIETLNDANILLKNYPDNIEYKKYKFLAFANSGQLELAKSYILNVFNSNKYKTIKFLLNETAKHIAIDELARALRILEILELIDPNNPVKLLKEANIYNIAGQKNKAEEILKKIDMVFPKYFISHFKFTDMYEDRDTLETNFLLELRVFDKQNCFSYPMNILEGYKAQKEGHIIDSKEAFERAIKINPNKPEAYVLLAQTLQLMSGYDNPAYRIDAETNYKKAMQIYQRENLTAKSEDMRRQIKHLNSTLSIH